MISIHLLTKSDNFDDLICLSRNFFKEYESHHADFFKIDTLTDEHVINYFSSFYGKANRKAFIARDGRQIVGYITVYVKDQASYWQIKQVGEISGLMVQKEYRRLGIGQLLLDEAIAFFIGQGVKYYTVYTAVANQAGLDFYRNNGLVPIYTTLIGETLYTSSLKEQ